MSEVWRWERRTGEDLEAEVQGFVRMPVQEDTGWRWEGEQLDKRDRVQPLEGHTRLMFLNVRRFKAGVEGWLLRDSIWDFAEEWDVDWVGLSDHWLKAAPGKLGKWDTAGFVGRGGVAKYRVSGVQAGAAKGYRGGGWGGKNMGWTFAQGH